MQPPNTFQAHHPARAPKRQIHTLPQFPACTPPAWRLNATNRSRHSHGEVPEWSNGAVSKTVEPSRVPRVRIPVSPPHPPKTRALRKNPLRVTPPHRARFGPQPAPPTGCLPQHSWHSHHQKPPKPASHWSRDQTPTRAASLPASKNGDFAYNND